MVLEARFVSSCLSFPSRAMPRLSRLLANKGTRVSVVVRVLLGGTFSLQAEHQRGELVNCSYGRKAIIDPTRPHLPQAFSRIQVPCDSLERHFKCLCICLPRSRSVLYH